VNHSVTFVSDSGVHTNTIESRWNSLKKPLPKIGTTKALYDSYFAEYCVRRRYLDGKSDKFAAFLQVTALVYKCSQDEGLISCAEENVTAAQDTVHKEVVYTPQFDIGFYLSDNSDDEMFA